MRARLLLIIPLLLTACGRPTPPATTTTEAAPEATRPLVAATIFPLADIVRQLGGEWFEVVTILPAGQSPSTYELTAEAGAQLERARLIVRLGPGPDSWIDGLLGASRAEVLEVMKTTTLRQPSADEPNHDHGHGHDQAEEVGGFHGAAADPHVWLDPLRLRDDIAPALAVALAQLEPAAETDLRANLDRLQQNLTQLDADIRGTLADCAKDYVAGHAAWGYFNERYGMRQVAVIEVRPGTDPAAGWVKEVIDTARRTKAKAVFAETQLSAALAETVARETGLKLGLLDPLGGENIEGRNSYDALLRYNANEFAKALAP